jgi:ABC-type nitrate/sulfonate/bicarbonate transport system permease component
MTRYVTAVLLALSGYVHADLYLHGYRAIPLVGPAFLLQASGSFAIAALLVAGTALVIRLAAAGLAAGALVGFALSRTIGIGTFVERGFDPAPQALISVLAEVAVLALLVVAWRLQARTAGARATS